MDNQVASSLAASLMQLSPGIDRALKGLRFMFDMPVIRVPYQMSTSTPGGQVISAGASNQPLTASDFQHSLEWPFEVREVRFDVDPSHTLRDLRVMVTDLTYNQQLMKNPVAANALVDANTLKWVFPERFVMRPMGGGWQIFVDNLDAANPLSVSVTLIGSLLVPRG